ncbi:MAG: M42 family peptidase, partial [Gammaproteobacteria bacterium]
MSQHNYDWFFETIAELVMQHSPSGAEAEIDRYLLGRLAAYEHRQDQAGNIVVRIAGSGEGAIAITAHKDEIGMIVKRTARGGRVEVRN